MGRNIDIVDLIHQGLQGQRAGWTPERIRKSLGESGIAVGNLLLQTREPITVDEICEKLGMPLFDACSGVISLVGWQPAVELITGQKGNETTIAIAHPSKDRIGTNPEGEYKLM